MDGNPILSTTNNNNNNKRKNNNSVMNALSKMGGDMSQVITSMNTKLLVSNFPPGHNKDMITQICEVFGHVKNVDLLKDTSTGEFKG